MCGFFLKLKCYFWVAFETEWYRFNQLICWVATMFKPKNYSSIGWFNNFPMWVSPIKTKYSGHNTHIEFENFEKNRGVYNFLFCPVGDDLFSWKLYIVDCRRFQSWKLLVFFNGNYWAYMVFLKHLGCEGCRIFAGINFVNF